MFSYSGCYPDNWSREDDDYINGRISSVVYEDTVSGYKQQIRELEEELSKATDDDEIRELEERIDDLQAELDNFIEENDYYD